MILFEFEGKSLLEKAGLKVPNSKLISSGDKIDFSLPFVAKAQVLSGKRADAGGIIMVREDVDLQKVEDLFSKTINKEDVSKILLEELIDIEAEYYVSISYDTEVRQPVLVVSSEGGTGIEERSANSYPINPLDPQVKISELIPSGVLDSIIKAFFDNDCLLLEINPLVQTKNGDWMALDAKVKLDDDAKYRHEEWDYPVRLVAGRTPTQNEIDAKKIDEGDYRGTAGSAYFDLDGDIAVLSSGGGVSLTAMDALIKLGGKPADFTEYSGNPPKEKVVKLTKIVLNKPNIHGLWVVGTVAANFTDIYETLSGFIDGLREAEKELGVKFDFPIVIRRGGPREKEAFEMLKEVKDFDLHLQGEEVSIAQSAEVMFELAKKYAAA
jgi:succinyl-CoA synthetase beta subunit